MKDHTHAGRPSRRGRWLAICLGAFALILVAACSPDASGPPADPNTTTVACPSGQACDATVTAPGSSIHVTSPAGSTAVLTIGVNNGKPLDCPDYDEVNPNLYVLNVSAPDRTKEVTITIDKSVIDAVPNFHLFPDILQCYGSPNEFKALSFSSPFYANAPLNPATGEYEGILPFCPPVIQMFIDPPCVESVTRLDDGDPNNGSTHDGDVQITSLLPAGDPRMK